MTELVISFLSLLLILREVAVDYWKTKWLSSPDKAIKRTITQKFIVLFNNPKYLLW